MEEREISLKELFNVIWKGKYIIGIAAFATFVVALIGAVVYDNSQSQVATIVSMQWQGISQGEYPDGSRFDYGEAIEPYVITLAVDAVNNVNDAQISSTTDEIRRALKLTPIVPSSVLSVIQSSLEDGEQITYYASDYKLVLNNGALDLPLDLSKELLEEIIDQFAIDFDRRFINQITVLDFTDADFASYDYLDAADILDAQVEAINNVISSRASSDFYSPTLGISFNDILVRTNLLDRIELDQIKTRTSTYLLTNNKNYLITNYMYKIQLAELDLAKATAKELSMQDLVDNYTGNTTTIWIPGLEDQEINMDTYYNTLMDSLVGLQSNIADLDKDIDFYQVQIDRLDGTDTSFTVTPEEQAAEKVLVEGFIASADLELTNIVHDANILLSEYNDYLSSNIIKPLMTPEYQSSVSKLLISAVGLILGAGIGAVVVLFKHDWE